MKRNTKIGNYMEEKGIRFIKGCIPNTIEATEDNKRAIEDINA